MPGEGVILLAAAFESEIGSVSGRRRKQDPSKPVYPVARGVAPPLAHLRHLPDTIPRSVRHAAKTVPPQKTEEPAEVNRQIESEFAVSDEAGHAIITRSPIRSQRKRPVVFLLQVLGVVVLAGGFMATGWWLRNRNASTPSPNVESANDQPTQAEGNSAATTVAKKPPEALTQPASVTHSQPATPTMPAQPTAPPKLDRVVPASPRPAAPSTTLTFQNDVLPIFQQRCITCHGDRNRFKGGLDVRSVRALEKGGETGPAIDRTMPEKSPLWELVANDEMPPGKPKLTEAEKRKLHEWLVGGGK